MADFIDSPNYPRACRTVILGEAYMDALKGPLFNIGITAIPMPNNPDLPPALSSHADLSVLHLGADRILLSPYLKGSHFSVHLKELGFSLYYASKRGEAAYPGDAVMNLLINGKQIICNQRVSHDALSFCGNREIVDVKQAYSRCSVLPVNERAVITSDAGICAKLRKMAYDVLQVEPGYIRLPGYSYGFWGGSSFRIAQNQIAFTGTFNEHPNVEEILAFLNYYEIEAKFLTSEPIFDIGTAIPILEKTSG